MRELWTFCTRIKTAADRKINIRGVEKLLDSIRQVFPFVNAIRWKCSGHENPACTCIQWRIVFTWYSQAEHCVLRYARHSNSLLWRFFCAGRCIQNRCANLLPLLIFFTCNIFTSVVSFFNSDLYLYVTRVAGCGWDWCTETAQCKKQQANRLRWLYAIINVASVSSHHAQSRRWFSLSEVRIKQANYGQRWCKSVGSLSVVVILQMIVGSRRPRGSRFANIRFLTWQKSKKQLHSFSSYFVNACVWRKCLYVSAIDNDFFW